MPDLSSAISIGKAIISIQKGYSLYKDHKLEKALNEIEKKEYPWKSQSTPTIDFLHSCDL